MLPIDTHDCLLLVGRMSGFWQPAGGARQAGTRFGVPMAITFEVFSTGWGS